MRVLVHLGSGPPLGLEAWGFQRKSLTKRGESRSAHEEQSGSAKVR